MPRADQQFPSIPEEAAAALLALITPGVVNNDLAHRAGGHGEEVGTVLPPWIGLVGQTQISLADERRRLQCVVGTFCAHLTMRKASEFLIHERR